MLFSPALSLPARVRLILLLALLLLPANRAAAESAAQLYQQAEEQFSLARLKDSLATLERARSLAHDARLQARISLLMGVILAVMNDAPAAQQEFRAALQLEPTTELDARKTKRAIVALFQEARQEVTGKVRVIDYHPGAQVLVDGKEAGVVPVTLTLPVGHHQIKVRIPAEQWETEGTVLVAYQQTQDFEKGLDLLPPIMTSPAVDLAPEPSAWKLYSGLASLAVGAGLLATGVVYGLKVSQANDDFERSDDLSEMRAIKDDAEGWETIELATLITGGVVLAAGAGLVLWHVLEPSPSYPREQRQAIWLPLLAPGQVGLSAAVRF